MKFSDKALLFFIRAIIVIAVATVVIGGMFAITEVLKDIAEYDRIYEEDMLILALSAFLILASIFGLLAMFSITFEVEEPKKLDVVIPNEARYIEYNANPIKRYGSDCFIRAVLLYDGLENEAGHWESTYDTLIDYGKTHFTMPTDPSVCDAYLQDREFTNEQYPDGNTINELINKFPASCIVRVGSHITFVENETVYDTWDCRNEIVNEIWYKETD